jgi:hypothetical protein
LLTEVPPVCRLRSLRQSATAAWWRPESDRAAGRRLPPGAGSPYPIAGRARNGNRPASRPVYCDNYCDNADRNRPDQTRLAADAPGGDGAALDPTGRPPGFPKPCAGVRLTPGVPDRERCPGGRRRRRGRYFGEVLFPDGRCTLLSVASHLTASAPVGAGGAPPGGGRVTPRDPPRPLGLRPPGPLRAASRLRRTRPPCAPPPRAGGRAGRGGRCGRARCASTT